MKWETALVPIQDADAYLAERVATHWFVSTVQALVVKDDVQIFVASCQRDPAEKKKGTRRWTKK